MEDSRVSLANALSVRPINSGPSGKNLRSMETLRPKGIDLLTFWFANFGPFVVMAG